MIKLLSYIKPYIGMLLLSIALLFVQALCELALPDYMSDIINEGVMSANMNAIWENGFKMIWITLLSTVVSVIMGYFASDIASSVSRDLRRDVFIKVESFSNAEFDKFSTASLITRTTNDITQIQILIVMVVRIACYAPIMGIGGVMKALSKSTSMSWILAVAVICLLIAIGIIFIISFPKMKIVQKLVDKLNLVIRENLDGMLVIRAFNSQKFESDRFEKVNRDVTRNNLFVNRSTAAMMPVMMLIMNIIQIVIVWVGSKQVSSFSLDIGDMMAYMQYGLLVIMSFLMLAAMFIIFPRAAVSGDRISEVLSVDVTIKDKENPEHFNEKLVPNVEFRNVDFAYPESDGYVLKDISFTAKAGQTTAFIGSTGSGKSTLANLVLRFYDVTNGAILIDGIDIRDVPQEELRDIIGYVPQKSILFSGTIASNLYYADKNSTEENIEKSCRVAQATEFIDSKPDGYDTEIAQGGTNVSGGQKQRLSIARALVKNAPIYIFDDSFSALDMKTDKKLREALKKETGDSTILLVAQRISSIMDADQIVVLDSGKIVGIGTHKELLKTCEVYHEIAASQLSEEELMR